MKKLYRSSKDRILGGVCGGIGDYFGIDPLLVRLVLIAFTVWNPGFLLAYLLAWLFVPLKA